MLSEQQISETAINTCTYLTNSDFVLIGDENGDIKLWDANKSQYSLTLNRYHKELVSCVCLFRDCSENTSKFLSSSWDHTVALWDLTIGQVIWSHQHDRMALSCNGLDSQQIITSACDDGWLRIFDPRVKGEVLKSKAHSNTLTSSVIAISGLTVATTSMDKMAHVWDIRMLKRLLTLQGHINIVSCCDFSRDERFLVTGSWDKTVRVWNIHSGDYRSQGAVILANNEGCVSAIHFAKSSSHKFITCSYDTSVSKYDMNSSLPQPSLKLHGHNDWVMDCSFNNDESKLVSVDKSGQLIIWDATGEQQLAYFDQKKNYGLNLVKCEICGKMFSLSQQEKDSVEKQCVFCRMKTSSTIVFTI